MVFKKKSSWKNTLDTQDKAGKGWGNNDNQEVENNTGRRDDQECRGNIPWK